MKFIPWRYSETNEDNFFAKCKREAIETGEHLEQYLFYVGELLRRAPLVMGRLHFSPEESGTEDPLSFAFCRLCLKAVKLLSDAAVFTADNPIILVSVDAIQD